MKKLSVLTVIIAGLLSAIPATSHAATPTIAIIDTAIDSSLIPQVTYEACFTSNRSCPNGTSYQEGKGSANINPAGWNLAGVDHGTQVVETALLANKNVNIVFIRLTDFTAATKNYGAYTHNDGGSLDNAIQWLAQNASKYNISAVSISQERHNFAKGTCPTDNVFSSSVQSLKNLNVPVLAGAGNDAVMDFVGFPACIQDVLAVGASSIQGQAYYFSNLGQGVDLMSIGRVNVTMPNGVVTPVMGTSIATPYAAALWVSRFTGSFQNQISQIAKLPVAKDGFKNAYPFIY